MALLITDAGGNDLQATPPAEITLQTAGKALPVTVYAQITENDTELPFQFLSGTIDWNDGSQPIPFKGAGGELVLTQTKALGFGTYAVKVSGTNNRAPVPDTISATFIITVQPFNLPAPDTALLFGPIIPSDTGSPSNQTWLFDTGTDLDVLASSVKMLLITTKGERIMQPNYGTRLRRILFSLNVQSLETLLHQEITQALAAYEPRVSVQTLAVVRDSSNVTINAEFVSNLTPNPFQINLGFSQ